MADGAPILALYRRYRPDTFEQVVGQEHTIGPITAALAKGRITHAYLFSGPRGCGKTTSARVLARSLNCVQGPTPTPCGQCPSCVDLANGGTGSLDVIEIDAASHRGIDDARDLRDRVTFVPVRDRYKVVIIDEAHQITPEGFNALLKVVEEPPEHVVFVFATTEPEKVLGTIRSRTHHFPFRLVPPARLVQHLEDVCRREQVTVAPAALSLVVRAGAGSVRDSMSVLDQLISGSDGDVDVDLATALLGYVPESLLDDLVDALAAVDGAAVYASVHHAVEAGHDPRRYTNDLLERLRTLLIVSRVGDGAAAVLPEVPEDAFDRLRHQASRFGYAELSRAADVVAAALGEMAGATSPRLLLELLVARLLIVGADSDGAVATRVERLERQLAALGAGGALPAAEPPPRSSPAAEPASEPTREPERPHEPQRPVAVQVPGAIEADASSGVTVEVVRRTWDQVIDRLRTIRRLTWTLVSENAQVLALDPRALTLGFPTQGLADAFNQRGHSDSVAEALVETLGVERKVVGVVGGRAASESDGAPTGDPGEGSSGGAASDPGRGPAGGGPVGGSDRPPPRQPPAGPVGDDGWPEVSGPSGGAAPATPAARAGGGTAPATVTAGSAAGREAGSRTAPARQRPRVEPIPPEPVSDDVASLDDPSADSEGLNGPDVLARLLGAQVIEDRRTDG